MQSTPPRSAARHGTTGTISAFLKHRQDKIRGRELYLIVTQQNKKQFAFLYWTFSLLLFLGNIIYVYLNAEKDAESPVFLWFEICLDAIFWIQPTALPRPQPLPALFGDSLAASSKPEAGLRVGVGGGVRDVCCNSLCVFQLKVKLEVGVASGVNGRPLKSSFS